jgi:hypothetical protein
VGWWQDNPQESVALALQRVFFGLQTSPWTVSTKELTRALGWDVYESFLHQDVHVRLLTGIHNGLCRCVQLWGDKTDNMIFLGLASPLASAGDDLRLSSRS